MIANSFLIDYGAPCDVISNLITSIDATKSTNIPSEISDMMAVIGDQNKVNFIFNNANFCEIANPKFRRN